MPANKHSKTPQPVEPATVHFRNATAPDAPKIWKLVGDSGVLDLNSPYCYSLLCRDFADTCVVARRGAEVVGFVTAYRPPRRRDTVFVWQIGVAEVARRQGLAKRLLHQLVSLPCCQDLQFLEATVTPSNTASRRLFQSFAEELDIPCQVEQGFPSEMFGAGNHEQEDLFRIGPFADLHIHPTKELSSS